MKPGSLRKGADADPYNVPALSGRARFTKAKSGTPRRSRISRRPRPCAATLIRWWRALLAYLALDKVKEATLDLDEAVQSEPNNGQAWSLRGLAYEKLGDKSKAAASYSRALAIRPRDEAARSGLARVGG